MQPLWAPPKPPQEQRKRWPWVAAGLVGAVIIVGVANGGDSESAATTPPTTAVAVQATTAPLPTTVVPPTTVRVHSPEVQPQARAESWCVSYIDLGNVSVYVPDSWDNYCDGVMWAGSAWLEYSYDEQNAVCSSFWSETDALLLETFMAGGLSRDQSIGGLDFLWTVC